MLHEEAKAHIRTLSDSDLAEYIRAGAAMYSPDAVKFAIEHLKERKASPSQVAKLETEAATAMSAPRAALIEKAEKLSALPPQIIARRKHWELCIEYGILATCFGIAGFNPIPAIPTFTSLMIVGLPFTLAVLHFLTALNIKSCRKPWAVTSLILGIISALPVLVITLFAAIEIIYIICHWNAVFHKDPEAIFPPLLQTLVALRMVEVSVTLIIASFHLFRTPISPPSFEVIIQPSVNI